MDKKIIIIDKGIKETVGPTGVCCVGAFVVFRK